MAELAAGLMVTPNVRLVRKLGAGAMGSVWIAEHRLLGIEVVVKFMADALSADHQSIARFTKEAAASARVKSPHVVQVFDHGVSEAGPFIVMERLRGEDLAARLDRDRKLPPAQVAMIVTQACKALSRAHDRGIVHRDIKPENMFLCENEEGEIFLKILDFGIAKGVDVRLSAATRTGMVMGSPYYMSPESLVSAKRLDFRHDLWSLGIVAFQALTGRRPFEAPNLPQLTLLIHGGPIPLPSAIDPSLPKTIDEWFLRACARPLEGRFASAKEMADAFVSATGVSLPNMHASSATIPAAFSAHDELEPQRHAGDAAARDDTTHHAPAASVDPALGESARTESRPATSAKKRGDPRIVVAAAIVALVALGAVLFALLRHPADEATRGMQGEAKKSAPPSAGSSSESSARLGTASGSGPESAETAASTAHTRAGADASGDDVGAGTVPSGSSSATVPATASAKPTGSATVPPSGTASASAKPAPSTSKTKPPAYDDDIR